MTTNNNEKKPTSNTFGIRLPNFEVGTMLQVAYFEQMCKLNIHLPVQNNEKGYPQFDSKAALTAYLKTSHAKAFYKKGKKVMRKYEETGTFEGFGVPLNKGLIELNKAGELKKKLRHLTGEVNPEDICLVIYITTEESKKTDQYLVHVFNTNRIVRDYNPETGTYSTEELYAEVWEFLDALNSWSKAMSNGQVHAQKHDSRYDRQRWERIAFELATGLGVDLRTAGKSVGSNSDGGNWNGGNKGNSISNRGNDRQPPVYVQADANEDIDAIIRGLQRAAEEEE